METSDPPQVITLGETMALVTPTTAVPLTTATDFVVTSGGAESNVAAHLALLGTPVAWASALGADALGDRILTELTAHGVDTRWVIRSSDAPTGVFFKDPGAGVLYYRSHSAAAQLSRTAFDAVPLEDARVVHLTGITPALSTSCTELIDGIFDRLQPSGTLISFDVNHRPSLWTHGVAPARLRALADRADIVFVGLDEARELWGTDTPDEVRTVLPSPSVIVVKDAAVGATEITAAGSVSVAAIPTEVTEAIGAGDAFAAGYLHAFLAGGSAEVRLQTGHERAHRTLQSTRDIVA